MFKATTALDSDVKSRGARRGRDADPYGALLKYALWALGRRDFSEEGMRQKLKLRILKKKLEVNGAPAIIKKVVTRLKELNYINDARIINSYFEYRLPSRLEGKYAYLVQMKKMGISKEMAQEEWDKRAVDQGAIARELVERETPRLARLKLDPQKRKQRLAGLLARKGFAGEIIWGLLRELD